MAEIASAYVSLLPSTQGFGSKLDSQISADIAKSGKRSGLSFGKLFAIGAGLGIGAKAFSFLGDSLAEGREAQKVSALVANAIKATGGAANVTANQVDRLATSISKKTGIDDEQIATASSLILTFKNVANEGKGVNAIFDRTTRAAVDLSAAGFGSVDSAAKQLAKALNDPIKGMSALGRSGVTFTADQQKQIKALVETGDLLQAQKIILGEVNSQVGGAAAATATQSEKAAVAAGNLKEQIGTALIPTVDRLAKGFTKDVAPAISSFVTGMQTGAGAGGRFAATLVSVKDAVVGAAGFVNQNRTAVIAFGITLAATTLLVQAHGLALTITAAGGLTKYLATTKLVTAATKTYAAVQWILNAALTANPIGLVIIGLVALGAGLVIAYKKSETFRNIVNGAFAAVKSAASSVATFFTSSVPAAFEKVKSAASATLGWVKSNWPVILGILTGPFGIAAVAIAKNWDSIRDGGAKVVEFIKGIPGKILSVFDALGAAMYAAGGKLMGMLASGIKAAVLKPYNELKAAADKLKGLLPGSPIKEGPLKPWNDGTPGVLLMDFLAKGISKGGKNVREALSKELDKLTGRLSTLKSDFKSLAESVSGAFTGDLFGASATMDEAGNVTATAGQNFIASLTAKKGELQGLLASFKTLQGWGIPASFLSQLFASGNGALITELAGLGQAGAMNAASLFGDVTSLGAQLGNKVATNDFGPNIDKVGEKIEEMRKDLKALPKENAKENAKVIANTRIVLEGGSAGQRAYLRTGGN